MQQSLGKGSDIVFPELALANAMFRRMCNSYRTNFAYAMRKEKGAQGLQVRAGNARIRAGCRGNTALRYFHAHT